MGHMVAGAAITDVIIEWETRKADNPDEDDSFAPMPKVIAETLHDAGMLTYKQR